MKLWWCVAVCLLWGTMCWADDQPPEIAAEPNPEVVSHVDPIAVHPLFGAAVPIGVYKPMTRQQRLQLYLRQTVTTPNPWLRTSISTGVAQIQGRQYSWGGGVWGYSRRYSSQYATYVIRNSFLSLGAWGLGHDTRYVQSNSHNPFARIGHAVMQNFLTVDREGKTTVNVSRILSGYGAGMIATTWQPNSKWSAQGIRAGNEQLIYGGVFNIGREFAPEVDHLMRRIFHRTGQ
jgi:hypothetical protein